MTRKLTLLCLLFFFLCLFSSGCVIPDEQQIRQFSDDTRLLSARVDDYQAAVNDVKVMLVEDKIISKNTAEQIDKIGAEIDRVQPHLNSIADAVKNADYVDGDDVGSIIKSLQSANTASAPVNPYAPLITAVLGVVSLVGGGFGVKKTIDAGKAETKLERTREGIAKFQGQSEPFIASKLHDTIKEKVANI